MKILWVIGFIPNNVLLYFGRKSQPFGGWVESTLNCLKEDKNISIGVVTYDKRVNSLKTLSINGITYFILPLLSKKTKTHYLEVIKSFSPHIVHFDGAEYGFANDFMEFWRGKNVVVIRGVLAGVVDHQYGGISISNLLKNISMSNILLAFQLFYEKRFKFKDRLKAERETLSKANILVGRTEWDKAYMSYFSPNAQYFSVNETLRDPFYNKNWELKKVNRYSIFIGSSNSPRKGAHIVLKSISILKKRFPDIHLYIAGTKSSDIKGFKIKKFIGYGVYFENLIKKLGLIDNVTFLGTMDAEIMASSMLVSHIFILPSFIENSSNTLGEAMLLGMPTISTYVGGTPSMASEKEVLFYRDTDNIMLSYLIEKLFLSDELCLKYSQNARDRATQNHDKVKNLDELKEIYRVIYNQD